MSPGNPGLHWNSCPWMWMKRKQRAKTFLPRSISLSFTLRLLTCWLSSVVNCCWKRAHLTKAFLYSLYRFLKKRLIFFSPNVRKENHKVFTRDCRAVGSLYGSSFSVTHCQVTLHLSAEKPHGFFWAHSHYPACGGGPIPSLERGSGESLLPGLQGSYTILRRSGERNIKSSSQKYSSLKNSARELGCLTE